MPNSASTVLQAYRKRIWVKATSETKRYWTEYRILTFIASPILGTIWSWRGLTVMTLTSIIFHAVIIFFAAWGLTFFYSLLHALVLVDRDSQDIIRRKDAEIRQLQEQLRPKSELSQKATEILVAVAEAPTNFANIIIGPTGDFLDAGNIRFYCPDQVELKEYTETIELELLPGHWITGTTGTSYYEPTAKGLKKGREILASENGRRMIEALHEKFKPT